MIWSEVEVKTTLEAEEAVTELFYGSGAQGVVVESPENLLLIQDDPTINYIDEEILNMDPNQVIIRGYFSEELNLHEQLAQLKKGIENLPACGLDPGNIEISITEVEEEDWANSWKQYYKPTRVGGHIIIKPTWEDYEKQPGEVIVNMDPGMAFGTGTHETTQLCVSAMENHVKKGDSVIDIGCGTGILSIVAALLGADSVIGVDLDPVAVKVAKDNLVLNQVEDIIEIREGDLVDVLNADEQADVVVANILAEAIVILTEKVKPFLKSGGVFISSGIIHDRLEMVLSTLKDNHFIVEKIDSLGEWNAVTARLED